MVMIQNTQIPNYKTGSITEPSLLLHHKRKGEKMTTGPVWKIKYLKTLKESTKNTGEHSVSLEKANFLKQETKIVLSIKERWINQTISKQRSFVYKEKENTPPKSGRKCYQHKELESRTFKRKNTSYKSRIKKTENSVYTLDIDFTNKNIQMVNKHMKWYSTSLVIRKLKQFKDKCFCVCSHV